MALTSIFTGKQRVQFIQKSTSTVIQLDASVKEVHSRESPATEFPVENGTFISDHITLKPIKLEITGIISDTPIGDLQGLLQEAGTTLVSRLLPPIGVVGAAAGFAIFSALSGSKSPSVAAYGQLLSLQSNSQPFDVITSLWRYESMWITSLSAPRDAETGNVLNFTVQLVQLLLVSPQTTNIQIFANPGLSANKANVGTQNGILAGAKDGVAREQSFKLAGNQQ